eukprot:s7564_g3.t1
MLRVSLVSTTHLADLLSRWDGESQLPSDIRHEMRVNCPLPVLWDGERDVRLLVLLRYFGNRPCLVFRAHEATFTSMRAAAVAKAVSSSSPIGTFAVRGAVNLHFVILNAVSFAYLLPAFGAGKHRVGACTPRALLQTRVSSLLSPILQFETFPTASRQLILTTRATLVVWVIITVVASLATSTTPKGQMIRASMRKHALSVTTRSMKDPSTGVREVVMRCSGDLLLTL